jgi:hypothetical protein
MSQATGDAGLNGCVTRRLALWGGQSWLQAGFPAGFDALESASAGKIARPTSPERMQVLT